MSEEPLSPPPFSSEVDEELLGYRTLSWWAVAALLLGLLSVTAVFSSRLVVLPVAAVALSIVALRTLAANPTQLIGRKAALAGLSLALLFGTWSVTHAAVRRHLLFAEARIHAQQWLEMVQAGRLLEAHQLHLPQESRRSPGTPLEAFYNQDREGKQAMETFFRQPPLKELVAAGPGGTVRFQRDELIESEQNIGTQLDTITQRYVLDYREDDQPRTMEFLLTLTRKYRREHDEFRWEVRDASLLSPARR